MLKIINTINSKVNNQQVVDYIFLFIFHSLILIQVLFLHNYIALFLFFILIIVDIFYFKRIKKDFYYKTFENDIKHIILDEKYFTVINTDNLNIKYNKNDITNVNLDIYIDRFKPSYRGPGYTGPRKITLTFHMNDSKKYTVEIRKLRTRSYLNFIFKLIDILSRRTVFEYSFSGIGYEQDIDEHIKNYRNGRLKFLLADKDRKDLKAFSLMFLLGGLGFCLFFVFALWDSFSIDLIDNAIVIVKLFSIFALISGLLYIPVFIDENNIRKHRKK